MISFEEYMKSQESKAEGSVNSQEFTYFKLENGESAEYVIDFQPETAKVHRYHSYYFDNRSTKVKCLYERGVVGSSCPLCLRANEIKVSKGESHPWKKYAGNYVYLRVFDMQGKMYLWERSVNWVTNNLVPIIEQYGDLSTIVLTISRTGEKLETKYSLIPKTERDGRNIIVAEVPKNVEEAIKETEQVDVAGRAYFVRTEEELKDFLETGLIFGRESADQSRERMASSSEDSTEVAGFDLESEIPF